MKRRFLTNTDLDDIRHELENGYLTMPEIAKLVGCSYATVGRFKDTYNIQRPADYKEVWAKRRAARRRATDAKIRKEKALGKHKPGSSDLPIINHKENDGPLLRETQIAALYGDTRYMSETFAPQQLVVSL